MIYSYPRHPRGLGHLNYSQTPQCAEIARKVGSIAVAQRGNRLQTVRHYYEKMMRSFKGIHGYSLTTSINGVMLDGVMLAKDNQSGTYLNLEDKTAIDILNLTKIWEYERPVDLGCGLGHIVSYGRVISADKLGKKLLNNQIFFGIESDYELVMAAEIARRSLVVLFPMLSNVRFLWGDFKDLNFARHDYFFFSAINPLKNVLTKFAEEAKPGSLFVTIQHGWQGEVFDERVIDVSQEYNYKYAKVFKKR